jgi:hypothetical protein
MTNELLEAVDELRKRSRKRIRKGSNALWCSWGRHRTYKHPELKEEYRHGSICLTCQVEIMANLESVVYMPQLSEAMHVKARKKWETKRAREAAEKPLRRKAPDMLGVVYYIRINGQVKIGYTSNLTQRSRHYPPGSELLAVEPGTRELEARRHRQFSRDLARGREWFHESDTIRDHVTALVGEFGKPDALMYQYTAHEAARKVGQHA